MRNGVFNPAIIEDARTGALHLYARARDDQNVSRIVHLVSTDGGARYQLDAACPVPLAPELLQGELADWAQGGGCEDARIFECRDRAGAPQWRMAFTVYNAERNVASIGFASAPSPGGPWAPEGLAFPEEVAAGRWTKSFVATRLPDGSYVGWGSRDISIPDTREGPQGTRGDGSLFMATSPNGRTWKVVVDPVALPREGAFDSRLVESAFVTPLGDGRFCLFVNGDGPPEGYQLGYQIYRPPTLREQVAAKLRGNEKLPLVLSERSSGPCFSHDQSATWETGPVEKVVFVAGGVLLAPRNGEPGRLRIAYGCNDMVCATADAPLA